MIFPLFCSFLNIALFSLLLVLPFAFPLAPLLYPTRAQQYLYLYIAPTAYCDLALLGAVRYTRNKWWLMISKYLFNHNEFSPLLKATFELHKQDSYPAHKTHEALSKIECTLSHYRGFSRKSCWVGNIAES